MAGRQYANHEDWCCRYQTTWDHYQDTLTRPFPSAKTSNPKDFPKLANSKNNSMEQSLEEANPSSATQKIPIILWNPSGHYYFHKNPSLSLS